MNPTNIIITGCSGGIGYELAQLFAINHFNVIAISRNKENLEKMQSSLPKELRQLVTIAVYDVANDPFENLQDIITRAVFYKIIKSRA